MTTAVYFDNICYFKTKLSETDMTYLRSEVNNIQQNFNNLKAGNSTLAGNIEREYYFSPEVVKMIEPILLPYARTYIDTNRIPVTDTSKLTLSSCWCNFQKKYEFNPVHQHSGVLSFVIWVNIPYTLEAEHASTSVKYSNRPVAGCFEFLYTDVLGTINAHVVPCEKSEENTLILFHSKMKHSVAPFYTSDEYRITISGNIE